MALSPKNTRKWYVVLHDALHVLIVLIRLSLALVQLVTPQLCISLGLISTLYSLKASWPMALQLVVSSLPPPRASRPDLSFVFTSDLLSSPVENYPGFPDGIQGPALMENFRSQSIRFGTEVITETISKLDLSVRPFRYWHNRPDGSEEVGTADCLIIATGASAKRLHLEGEEIYWQSGISACAVCDGAVPIFKLKVVILC